MDKREKRLNVGIPLLAIAMSLVVGALVMLCLGKNPLQACGLAPKASYAGHKGMITDFTSFLNYLTPMIFAALAVAVALRAGLFNIGVSGQMLAAGFLASITVGYSSLHWAIAKPLVILIGIAAGAPANPARAPEMVMDSTRFFPTLMPAYSAAFRLLPTARISKPATVLSKRNFTRNTTISARKKPTGKSIL